MITELKKKTKYLIVLLLVIQISCSSSEENQGATWVGPADFMHVTKDKMEMTYSVDVVGQKMYLGGFYEVLKMGTDTVIYKIKVTDLEFGKREDAIPFCRIWGKVEDTNIESYLLAQECFPVSKNS